MTEPPAAPCWAGVSVWRFTTSVVCRSHREEGPGKNLPFSVENKWQLLAMMTVMTSSCEK
ncbi:hypothetical protein U0070_003346 [Myodes glareolus]|uniref:Cytochrome c oxidase subunit 7C, mitochondrial n=1 Tax=Myodes glareolus TaxID=447135 RepID=A0AAW0JBW5_MYOGA